MPNTRIVQRFHKFDRRGGGNDSPRASCTGYTRPDVCFRGGMLPEVAEVDRLAAQPHQPAIKAAA